MIQTKYAIFYGAAVMLNGHAGCEEGSGDVLGGHMVRRQSEADGQGRVLHRNDPRPGTLSCYS